MADLHQLTLQRVIGDGTFRAERRTWSLGPRVRARSIGSDAADPRSRRSQEPPGPRTLGPGN